MRAALLKHLARGFAYLMLAAASSFFLSMLAVVLPGLWGDRTGTGGGFLLALLFWGLGGLLRKVLESPDAILIHLIPLTPRLYYRQAALREMPTLTALAGFVVVMPVLVSFWPWLLELEGAEGVTRGPLGVLNLGTSLLLLCVLRLHEELAAQRWTRALFVPRWWMVAVLALLTVLHEIAPAWGGSVVRMYKELTAANAAGAAVGWLIAPPDVALRLGSQGTTAIVLFAGQCTLILFLATGIAKRLRGFPSKLVLPHFEDWTQWRPLVEKAEEQAMSVQRTETRLELINASVDEFAEAPSDWDREDQASFEFAVQHARTQREHLHYQRDLEPEAQMVRHEAWWARAVEMPRMERFQFRLAVVGLIAVAAAMVLGIGPVENDQLRHLSLVGVGVVFSILFILDVRFPETSQWEAMLPCRWAKAIAMRLEEYGWRWLLTDLVTALLAMLLLGGGEWSFLAWLAALGVLRFVALLNPWAQAAKNAERRWVRVLVDGVQMIVFYGVVAFWILTVIWAKQSVFTWFTWRSPVPFAVALPLVIFVGALISLGTYLGVLLLHQRGRGRG